MATNDNIEKLKNFWSKVDNEYIKPYIIHNWPISKNEHDKLAIRVKEVFIEFQKERKFKYEQEDLIDT
jgi:hypothetical protein